MKWCYLNNKSDTLVFQCEAESITDADKLFFDATGIVVVKASHISCYSPDWGFAGHKKLDSY